MVSDVEYRAGDRYCRHAHDRAYLMVVLSGGFTEHAPEGNAELGSGSVITMPSGHPHHDLIASTGARGVLVTLEPSFAKLPARWSVANGGVVSRAMIALHCSYAAGGVVEALSIEECLLDAVLYGSAERSCGRETRAVRIARDYIESHATTNVRLADAAREAGVTSSYLSRAFRRCAGTTMAAYLRAARARHAARMLASAEMDLAQVALAAGFADQSHLCRVFSAHYGVTPRRYRQLARRSNPSKN